MADLEVLLEVQNHDTVIDQLHHRQRTLPERARLQQVEAEQAQVERELTDVRARLAEARAQQTKLEGDLAATEARIAEIEKRMFGGSVTASRDLQAMQEEVDSLKRRRSLLEDDVLVAMESAEPLQAELEALEGRHTGLDDDGGQLRAAIAEAEVAIDKELAEETSRRQTAASGLPEDLVAEYERLRARLGGIGAARLVGPSCTGCHLTLPSSELERIRHEPPDAILHCDQCGRLLVR